MKRRIALASSIMAVLSAFTACGDDSPPTTNPDAAASSADATPSVADASPPDAAGDVVPALYHRVDGTDQEIASEALTLLQGPSGADENCGDCHSLTRQNLRQWRALSDTTLRTDLGGCLTDLTVSSGESAQRMIDCLRRDPTMAGTAFSTPKLGVFAAAAHLDWFAYIFQLAYGDSAAIELEDFKAQVGMPRGTHVPFTQAEFDVVTEWFLRGLPLLDETLPEDPPPAECTPGISGALADHVAAMATGGWRAVNAEHNLLNFGCAGATDSRDCLSSFPLSGTTTYSEGWADLPGAVLRLLRANSYRSSFWTRSSADGRYVGHGANLGPVDAAIIDLATSRIIPTHAYYDPGFFPDNSAFMFQTGQAHTCSQSLLDAEPAEVTFDEAECSTSGAIDLYQHVGAALEGGDYWTVDGQFVSDDGGHAYTGRDPRADFGQGSDVQLTAMINDGQHYVPSDEVEVAIPYEGDTVISPSARLMISRVSGPNENQLGFVVRAIEATETPAGYQVEAPEIARYCFNGSKPGFSYDERWMVIHHYIGNADAVDLGFSGPDDPEFENGYGTQGSAQIYLVDLLTGVKTRITKVQPGQYALFPHFRSDGWIYFIVRQANTNNEYIVASDAALMMEQQSQ
jgi:hypothetical protein